jgi:hypothetical protein
MQRNAKRVQKMTVEFLISATPKTQATADGIAPFMPPYVF